MIEDDGPELTLNLPAEGAVVDFMASMEVSDGPSCWITANVTEGSGESALTVTSLDGSSNSTERFQTVYSSLEGHGWGSGGMWVVHPLTGGTRVFRLRYQVFHTNEQGSCEARVHGRHIYAVVLG